MAMELLGLIPVSWELRLTHAFAEAGIADIMAKHEGPMSSSEIAAALHYPEKSAKLLYRMLRALSVAQADVVKEVSLDRFELTEAGFALQDVPGSLRPVMMLELSPVCRGAWEKLEEIIKDGEQEAFSRVYGVPAFEFMNQKGPLQEIHCRNFNAGMTAYSDAECQQLIPLLKEAAEAAGHPIKTIVDVGGNRGALGCVARNVLGADKTIVTELAAAVAGCESTETLEFVVQDMFKGAAKGGDMYLLKHILHDFGDDECPQILARVREAAPPGAVVVICEYIVGPPGAGGFAKAMDCHMMVMLTGRERTFDEYKDLLEAAGFEGVTLHGAASPGIGAISAVVP